MLWTHLRWRREFLSACHEFDLANPTQTSERLKPILVELEELKKNLPPSDASAITVIERITTSFMHLCEWAAASLNADAQAERWLRAARAQAILAAKLHSAARFETFAGAVTETIRLIEAINDIAQIESVANQILRIPVPVFAMTVDHPHVLRGPNDDEPSTSSAIEEKGPFVLKVMFDIDRKPWSSSYILLSNTLYDIRMTVMVPRWPKDCDQLLIEYVSTLDRSKYELTPFLIKRPEDKTVQEFNLTGQAAFTIPQKLLSEPIHIQVIAGFRSSSNQAKYVAARIVGYHELQVRVSDPAHVPPLIRRPSINERVNEIIQEVQHSLPGLNPDHLNDFVDVLSTVADYMGFSLQNALYTEKHLVDEAEFHKNMLREMARALGEDVKEKPKQGGGEPDIQYRSVTTELKVEDEISDRRKMIEKYLAQPTQYSSAGGAQLGVLCILDQTEKTLAPANPKNQITLETPPIHGFPEGNVPFPTKIAVVIVDGNLRRPSSYSR